MLFELHEDKQPKVVNVKRNSQTVQAFHYLEINKVYNGIVVYRVSDLLRQLRKTLTGSKEFILKSLQTFKKWTDTTNKQVYTQCLN
jgi:hypothetical protein